MTLPLALTDLGPRASNATPAELDVPRGAGCVRSRDVDWGL